MNSNTLAILIRFGLFFFLFLGSVVRVNAQQPPSPFRDFETNCLNIGFEEGNFSEWDLFAGEVTHGPGGGFYSFVNVMQLVPPPGGTSTAQHLICTLGNYDPVVPAIPMVWPQGGNYSLRLGDGTGNGARAASVRRTFHVGPENPALIYAYAVFLQDPNHRPQRVPYFLIRMWDQYGNSIPAADYAVIANISSDPNFISIVYGSALMHYKNWTTVFVPLDDYIGQDVTLEFRTGDCTEGAHFGYAYVDATCYSPEIRISSPGCGDYMLLTAPDGAASYSWTGPGVNGLTTQSVRVTQSGTYSVTLIPVTGSAYAMSIDTTLIIDSLNIPPTAGFSSNSPVCTGTPIVFTDTSFGNDNPIVSWQWDFGNTHTATSQHATHLYDTSGTYEATLIVTDLAGCSDTAKVWIEVLQRPDAVITPAGPFCSSEEPIALTAIAANGTWAADCGACIDASGGVFNPAAAGVGIHTVTYSFGGMCSNSDTLTIEVLANSDASISPAGPFCIHDTPFTLQPAMPGGTWTGNGVHSGTGVFDPQAAGPGTHLITYSLSGQCGDTQHISLIVNEVNLQGISTDPLCANMYDGSIEVIANGTPPYTYVLSGSASQTNHSGSFANLSTGVYTVTVTDQNGCSEALSYTLSAPAPVTATFTATPLQGEAPLTVHFTNTSLNASTYSWSFGNGNHSSEENPPAEIYSQGGTYLVMLIATNGPCSDTTYATIQVELFSSLIVYNVFSPNGDGINDQYLVTAKNIDKFECIIFNRWGQKVFTSTNPSQGWNGKDEAGNDYPEGTYYYLIQATGTDGKTYHFKGFLTLVRK